MKQTLLRKFWLRVCMLVAVILCGAGSAWGETTVTKTVNQLVTDYGWTVSAGSEIGTLATSFNLDANITISTTGNPNCGSIWGSSTYDWRLYQNASGNVIITANNGATLKSVKFTYSTSNGGVLKDSNTGNVNSNTAKTVSGTSVTFTVGNTGNKTIGQVRITAFEVVYEGGGSTPATPAITAPSTLNLAASATSGEFEYSISNATSATLNATSTADWISNIQVGNSNVTFSVSENTDISSRTANITLSYEGAESKNVAVTQAGAEITGDNFTWNLSIDETATATADEISWTNAYATMLVERGEGGTNANNYYGGDSNNRTSTRFYSGSNLTITPEANCSITSVVFTATTDNYASTLKNSTWTNATASVDGTTVTVIATDPTAAISAAIGGTCGFTAVKVYYTSAPDTRTAVNLLTFTATTSTLVIGETTETSVTNDQSGWTPAYTYTSDNQSVATVDANGVITAVGKGTANITVELDIPNTGGDYKKGETRTKSLAITVRKPSHTVTFMANGEQVDQQLVEEDANITVPTVPTIEGYEFVGWTRTEMAEPSATAPTLVNVSNMGTNDLTYYAVYAEGSSTDVTATFDASDISNLTETDTRTWKDNESGIELYIKNGQHYTSGTPKTWTVTKSSSSNNYYMSISRAGAQIKKVTVTISGANYAVSDFYGYEKTTDEDGTDLTSTVTTSDLVSTLNLTDNYEQILMWSGTSYQIRATKVDVEATIPSFDNYCTTIPSETVPVSVGATGFATFSCDKALDFTNIKTIYAYTATVSGKDISFKRVNKVPAYTGLLLRNPAGEAQIMAQVPVVASATAVENNALVAVREDIASLASENSDGSKNYILNKPSGKNVGFFLANNKKVGAGKAYLTVPVGVSGVKSFAEIFGGDTDAIENLDVNVNDNATIYNIAGQRVGKMTKGLYIVNGKKVLVK